MQRKDNAVRQCMMSPHSKWMSSVSFEASTACVWVLFESLLIHWLLADQVCLNLSYVIKVSSNCTIKQMVTNILSPKWQTVSNSCLWVMNQKIWLQKDYIKWYRVYIKNLNPVKWRQTLGWNTQSWSLKAMPQNYDDNFKLLTPQSQFWLWANVTAIIIHSLHSHRPSG